MSDAIAFAALTFTCAIAALGIGGVVAVAMRAAQISAELDE
jgi:heme/copper-type cytochrome/quinol oxidase subunit 1